MAITNVNMHQLERKASTILGGILLFQSFARRSPSLGEKALAAVLLYRGISGHSFLYQALGMSTASKAERQKAGDAPEVERSITIEKPANDLYRFWREPQHLSQIMGAFAEVTEGSGGQTHWAVQGPFNRRIEWDSQIVEDRPGEMIRWKSLDGARIPNEGIVRFRSAPRDWGTEVTLRMRFNPPGGALGNKIVKQLSFAPRMMVEKALRRFKSLAETGEFPTLKRNPAARTESYAQV